MKITSYGGAENVTGSKHLLEINGTRILLDCGMFQGHRQEAAEKNRELGFEPEKVHAVILSHAHIDHSGLLPMLAKQGYRGVVFTTPATRDLCSIMLMDSAHIQKRDAEWLSKKEMAFVPPPYSEVHVHQIMRQMVTIPYEIRFQILPNMYLTFHEAGHVLGSAMVELEYSENGRARKLVFSGDIGRKNISILEDPWEPRDADVVIMEGTYGNREHAPVEQMEAKLAAIVKETYERGGKLLIPSFALERAQEVIYTLKRLEVSNGLPNIPVFVDSPLTVNITEVFRMHSDSFDSDFHQLMANSGSPFQLRHIRYIRSTEESIGLNEHKGPAIIIAASGMCEYGRIVHHLRNNIENPNTTILIVGFQAQHTLGRRIVERHRFVRIFGVERELRAQVKIMNEFSAHAGRSELLEFGLRFRGRAEKLLLVHGELEALNALKLALQDGGMSNVQIQAERRAVTV